MCLHSNANSTSSNKFRLVNQEDCAVVICSTNYMFSNDKIVHVVYIRICVVFEEAQHYRSNIMSLK
jgi:hypothetical protein